jgi:hypothetical protein
MVSATLKNAALVGSLTFSQDGFRPGSAPECRPTPSELTDKFLPRHAVFHEPRNQDGKRGENVLILDIALSLQSAPHAFPGLSFFHPLLLTRLEKDGVLLDLLDDRFLLNFPFEPLECAFQRFAFFDDDKSQRFHLL